MGAWVELQQTSQHVMLNTVWFTGVFSFNIHHHEISQVGAVVPIFMLRKNRLKELGSLTEVLQ